MNDVARSLDEAKARGLTSYTPAEPCPRGHISARSLNRRCLACLSLAKVAPVPELEAEPVGDVEALRARWQVLERARPMVLLDYRTAPPGQVRAAARVLIGVNKAQDRLAGQIALAEREARRQQ